MVVVPSSSVAPARVLVVGSGCIGLRTALELLLRRQQQQVGVGNGRKVSSVKLVSPRHPLHPSTCSVGAGGLWMPFHINHPNSDRWSMETLDELLSMIPRTDKDKNHNDVDRLVEIVPTVVLKREHSGPSVHNIPNDHYVPLLDGGGAGRATVRTTASEATAATGSPPTKESDGIASSSSDCDGDGDGEGDGIPAWASSDPRLAFQHLTVEMLSWQNLVHRLLIPPQQELFEAGYLHCWMFRPPIVNSPAMLEHMLKQIKELQTSGDDFIDVETGTEFQSMDEILRAAAAMDCNAVMNCTGLGAAGLCGDGGELFGARGVTIRYDRSTAVRRSAVRENSGGGGDHVHDAVIIADEEPWGSETEPCYLIPRGDDIIVGGSYLARDTEQQLRESERDRLLQNANRLGIDVEKSMVASEWTGFRPFRSRVRCERDEGLVLPVDGVVGEGEGKTGGIDVVHNYGHGGSGWTVYVGAAKEAADILLGTTSTATAATATTASKL